MLNPLKRQEIIVTALLLFNEAGFHSTGVNMIMARAKISKTRSTPISDPKMN
jgi:AcrR family transcriptional regulator